MFNKRIIVSFLILSILITCIGIASAHENTTQSIGLGEINEDIEIDENEEILSSNHTGTEDKKDADFDIDFGDEYLQGHWSYPIGPSLDIYPTAENMTGNFTVYVDNEYYTTGGVNDFLDSDYNFSIKNFKAITLTIRINTNVLNRIRNI